jgi:hypothetical protein
MLWRSQDQIAGEGPPLDTDVDEESDVSDDPRPVGSVERINLM